jgi:hypothetical protein
MPNLAAELHLCSDIPTGEITRGSMEFLLLPPPHNSQNQHFLPQLMPSKEIEPWLTHQKAQIIHSPAVKLLQMHQQLQL